MKKLLLLCIFTCQVAFAADNIHGYVDVTFKNQYVTPRGLLVTNKNLTTQVIAGLSLDLYKTEDNVLSVGGWIWNDLWSGQHNHKVGSWNECDWGVGAFWTINKDLKLGAEYLEFLSPPHNFSPEHNIQFSVAYNDSHFKLPVAFMPYAKLFWTVSGDSTVVVGRHGKTFDVELGIVPTIDFRDRDIALILTAPTWITVGPANFWNGGKGALKREKSNFGVFSTGLKGEIPITYFPESMGAWYIDAGIQYYHLINDNLLQAQTITLRKQGVHNWRSAHRNFATFSIGVGCRF